MKINKLKFFISALVVVLPYIAGLLLWDTLGASASPLLYPTLKSALFILSPLFFLLHIACVLLTAYTNRNADQHKSILGMSYWILPCISLYSMLIVYGIAFGLPIDVKLFSCLLLGILLIIMGNFMPKCKQNSTMGIKLSWTLANEENWNATHRFGGKVMVGAGFLLLLASLLPLAVSVAILLVAIVGTFVAMVLYSYLFYKKQLAEGRATAEDYRNKRKSKWGFVGIALLICLLACLTVIMFTGKVTAECGEDSLLVDATYASSLQVPYADIDAVSYHPEGMDGLRLYGFSSFRILQGSFENESLGVHTRYSYTAGPVVLLQIGEEFLVIGLEDEAATKALYEDLLEKTGIQAN